MTIQVPYLAERAIENDAEALLAEFVQARGITLRPPIPIEDIIEKYLRLDLDFDDLHKVLGIPQVGPEPEIFGALWVDKREIFIHKSLDPDEHPGVEGRYRFTLAHENGHWRLHRRYVATDPAQISLLSDTSEPSVICRSSQAKERIEWQADFYASCLLMPRAMVFDAWRTWRGNDSPAVYDSPRDAFATNRHDPTVVRSLNETLRASAEPHHPFDKVAKHFAPSFGVSIQAMRIRLEKLGLLLSRDSPQGRFAAGW